MIVSYLGRLALLSFAAFFLVHTGVAIFVSMIARTSVRHFVNLNPALAARLFLGLRLLPAATAVLFVTALCAPSYLLFEPEWTSEEIGPLCLVLAFLGAAICLSGLARGILAAIRSSKYLLKRQEHDSPAFLLAGVVRPRLIVSPIIRATLSKAEFEAALRHEQAHDRANDNLKLFLILISPSIFPFGRAFSTLGAAWRRVAEWAADDSAVSGSPENALALASALIRVGRLSNRIAPLPLATSLLADTGDLSTRVERLISGGRFYSSLPRALVWGTATAVIAATILAPTMLNSVHHILEALAH